MHWETHYKSTIWKNINCDRHQLPIVYEFLWLALVCRIHCNALEYVSFGKPNPFVFKNAEAILRQLQSSCNDNAIDNGDVGSNPLKTIYMIGDNPLVDIKGARQVCLTTCFDIQFFCMRMLDYYYHWMNQLLFYLWGNLLILRQDILGFLFWLGLVFSGEKIIMRNFQPIW